MRCEIAAPLMIECAVRGSEKLAGKTFCGDCHAPLADRCPECGPIIHLGNIPMPAALWGKNAHARSLASSARNAPDLPSQPSRRAIPISPTGSARRSTALFADIGVVAAAVTGQLAIDTPLAAVASLSAVGQNAVLYPKACAMRPDRYRPNVMKRVSARLS
jgi:hypothetical protein